MWAGMKVCFAGCTLVTSRNCQNKDKRGAAGRTGLDMEVCWARMEFSALWGVALLLSLDTVELRCCI